MRQDRHGSLLRYAVRNQLALSHRRNRPRRISADLRDRVSSNCMSALVAEEMKIRDAVEADLPAIIDIYNAAIATRMSTAQLEPVTVESRRRWLSEHSPDRHALWVAETAGRVIGGLSFKSFLPRCA